MTPRRISLALLIVAAACGDNDRRGLDDFLPPIPAPDGSEPSVRAGVASEADLIPGDGAAGLPGDFFIASAKARFIIQAPGRAMGQLPWGGNPVDAALASADGALTPDHMGEIGPVYGVGRTCGHDRVDVIQDGSGGGAAVIRARGRTVVYDTINVKGVGLLPIAEELDPDVDDGMECATTYILRPDSTALEVAWTFFNPGEIDVRGPLGVTGELGGEAEPFAPLLGFFRGRVDPLAGNPTQAEYMMFQGPDAAYGIVPRDAGPSSIMSIAGHTLLLGVPEPLSILSEENWLLHVPGEVGSTYWIDLVVARDASGIEAHHRRDQALEQVTGTVDFTPSGDPVRGARVGFYEDADGDGAVGADDPIVTYADVDDEGRFGLALAPGSYLADANLIDQARSAGRAVDTGGAIDFELPEAAVIDHTTVDDETGMPIPVKLTVIGADPAPRDYRVHPGDDVRAGLVTILHTFYGTSNPAGADPGDPPLRLPAGGPYRIYASRGPEWSIDTVLVSPAPGEELTRSFRLRRVVDTGGYLATEYHQHSIGSPDSAVRFEDRLASLVSEGIELFAATDHDHLSDYDPLIDRLELRDWIDAMVGVESTSAVWGHFNSYPMEIDPSAPDGGPPDWAEGTIAGLDMRPRELFEAMRARGARVVQINHPRSLSLEDHQAYFDRVGLTFDFARRTFHGDLDMVSVPASYMRLPGDEDLFSATFDALEVFNGFVPSDSDGDGVTDLRNLDRVMRDWMNFLSLGYVAVPVGNSDSHALLKTPAGLPRTLVRVGDDSASALRAGLEDEVFAGLLESRDVVVTDGPMVRVTAGGDPAIGREVAAEGGAVTLSIAVQSSEWIDFDTIEIFANATFDPGDARETLIPVVCYTTRDPDAMDPEDPCLLASLPPRPLAVDRVDVTGDTEFFRREAAVELTLAEEDVPTRSGARGTDAWVVVRVRGQRALYPVLVQGVVTEGNLADLLAADTEAELAPLLFGRGVPAAAFTAPVFVDFDGGGYLAPFAP